MIPSLQRVTTEYVETEDRIRLNGLAGEDTICIWLSKRLADRLVATVTRLLEQQHVAQEKAVKNDLLSFSQHAAQQANQRSVEKPVAVSAKTEAESSWLAITIQITPDPYMLQMTFVGKSDEQKAELKMGVGHLRQWINILFLAYKRGAWATDAWPEWMHNNFTPEAAPQVESKKVH